MPVPGEVLGIPTNIPVQNPTPTVTGQMPGQPPNIGNQSQGLAQLINLIAMQKRAALPKPIGPTPVQAGDLSRNFVPFSPGSTKYNSKVAIAQSVGQLIAGAENKHEEKKARDIAYDVDRINVALQNPTAANIDMVNKIIYKDGIQAHGLTKEGKELQKALDINFGSLIGGPSKENEVEGYIKKARQLIFGNRGQTPAPQQPAAQGAQPPAQAGQPPVQQAPAQAPVPPISGGAPVQAMPPGLPAPQQQQPPMGGAPPQMPPNPNVIQQTGTPQMSSVGPQGFVPGKDAYGALMRQMPEAMGFTPQAALQMQAIQGGLLPTADKQLDYAKAMATNDMKWKAVQAVVGQREADSIRKAILGEDRVAALTAANKLTTDARIKAALIGAGAQDRRTAMAGQITDARLTTGAIMQSQKLQVDALNKDITVQGKILGDKNASSDAKSAAQKQLDYDNASINGMRANLEQLKRQYDQYGAMAAQIAAGSTDAGTTTDNDPYLDKLLDIFGPNE